MRARIPFVSAFLAMAGAVLAARNPLAMLVAKGIEFKNPGRERKRKGRGLTGRNLFRKGGSRFPVNGARECARRRRQIEQGILTASNGLGHPVRTMNLGAGKLYHDGQEIAQVLDATIRFSPA